jgi:hypothetical protein
MTRRCSRCGHPAIDAVGTPQTSLFDVAPADPRATDAARAELRAGRVLCSACQRTEELFPAVAPVVVMAPERHFPRPVVDYLSGRTRYVKMPCGHHDTATWAASHDACRACRAGQSDRTNALIAATTAGR